MSRILTLLLAVAPLLSSQQWPNKEDTRHVKDRSRWFYGQRTFPTGTIPPGARRDAILQIQRNDAAVRAQRQATRARASVNQAFALTTDSTNWTMIGPRPTNANNSPTSGRINAIALDPRDPNVIYVGAAAGGVWKSTDAGATWKPLTDNQVSLAMGAIAIDPSNPDTVYAGTGEENFSTDSYFGAGILKSTDGGASWTNTPGPFVGEMISALAVHPTNGRILLCASTRGILRSEDAGTTWTVVLLGVGISIFFDPNDPSSAWASVGDPFGSSRNGVYHSTDAGLTWRTARGTGTLVLPTAGVGRIELAMAPSAPDTMYAQTHNTLTDGMLDIYKTTDGAATWRRLNVPAAAWGAQMFFDNTIRVSPKDPDVVWSGGVQVFRSLNGGSTWASLAQTGANGTSIHVDYHALVFTPDGSKLYLGNDGGLYSTTDITATRVNWSDHNGTLAITKFYPGMSMDSVNPVIAMGGTQDNGTQRLSPDGSWNNVACGDGGFTAIDPSFPTLFYGACQRIDIRRNIGVDGAAWIPANHGLNQADTVEFIAPFVMDPSEPQTLYFGTYRLWQTRDSGGKWSAISGDLTSVNRGRSIDPAMTTIALAPSDSGTIYVGTANGRVQVTTDAQHGTAAVWTDRTGGLPARAVTKIVVDPVNPTIAYAAFSGFPVGAAVRGYIFKTTNTGATWNNISSNLPPLPVNDIAIDPDLPDTLYLATDSGVQATTDGGATWSTLGNGLPNVVVQSLVLHRATRVLRAGTHGRSVWEIAIPLARPTLQPVITSLSPSKTEPGGAAFTLSVTGSNFVGGTVIRWNGQDRQTRFVDGSHVTAEIPAGDIANPGRAAVLAFNSSTGGGTSEARGFLIGGPPQVTPEAFVSAASPSGGSVLAPGSIASLYGTNLASGVTAANGAPLPSTLGGTTMLIGGGRVPLFFVSPGQINFQVPVGFNTSLATFSTPLTIVQGPQSTTITVRLRIYSPALFTTNAQGTGQASTVIAGTATLVAPAGAYPGSRPAKAGEFLSIYCTGLGAVSNQPSAGSPSPSSPLAQTLTQPTVTIGGVSAQVSFSGLAPGFVGLYQVNVKVPDSVSPGAQVPLTLTIGGVPSNTTTIAID